MKTLYEPSTHTYFVDGKKVPSVNAVLTKVGIKDEYTGDPYYGELGRLAADAIEMDSRKVLDYDALDETLRPRVDGFRKFVSETAYEPMLMEEAIFTTEVCGRIDSYGILPNRKGFGIIDYKCVQVMKHYGTCCQLSGYASTFPRPVDWIMGLQLDRDGNYAPTFYEVKWRNVWDSIMTLYRLKTAGLK